MINLHNFDFVINSMDWSPLSWPYWIIALLEISTGIMGLWRESVLIDCLNIILFQDNYDKLLCPCKNFLFVHHSWSSPSKLDIKLDSIDMVVIMFESLMKISAYVFPRLSQAATFDIRGFVIFSSFLLSIPHLSFESLLKIEKFNKVS